MKLTIKTLASAVAGLGFLTSMAADADACGGRGGGGFRGGFSGGYRSNYNYNYYPQQQCATQYPQQQYGYQYPQQYPQQYQQQVPQQQIPQQGAAQQQVPQQQVQQQIPQQGVAQGQAAPVAQNAVAPQARVAAKPVSTGGANLAGANTAAPAAAPQQAPAQPADGSAEMSALQALSGWDGSEQPAANAETTAQAGFSPTGNYVATLANGATVRLRMLDDSTFTWIATNKGKDSSFQGTFTLDGGSLKLIRSSDNQKLEGTFAQTQNGFTFKLTGKTETNMSFVRS